MADGTCVVISKNLQNLGFNTTTLVAEPTALLSPSMIHQAVENKSIIYISEHGNEYQMSFGDNVTLSPSTSWSLLSPSLVVLGSCDVGYVSESENPNKLLINSLIERGAVSVVASINYFYSTTTPVCIHFLNSVLYHNGSLGEAFLKSQWYAYLRHKEAYQNALNTPEAKGLSNEPTGRYTGYLGLSLYGDPAVRIAMPSSPQIAPPSIETSANKITINILDKAIWTLQGRTSVLGMVWESDLTSGNGLMLSYDTTSPITVKDSKNANVNYVPVFVGDESKIIWLMPKYPDVLSISPNKNFTTYYTLENSVTSYPTPSPTLIPTLSPTPTPTVTPSITPTTTPILTPTPTPTQSSTIIPSMTPTATPKSREPPANTATPNQTESPSPSVPEFPQVTASALVVMVIILSLVAGIKVRHIGTQVKIKDKTGI
jgi:hypothetical protein